MLWKKLSTQKTKDIQNQATPTMGDSSRKKQEKNSRLKEQKDKKLLNIGTKQVLINKNDTHQLQAILQTIQSSVKRSISPNQSSVVDKKNQQKLTDLNKNTDTVEKSVVVERAGEHIHKYQDQNQFGHQSQELQLQFNRNLKQYDYVNQNSFKDDKNKKGHIKKLESKNYAIPIKDNNQQQNLSSTIAPISKRAAEFKVFSLNNKKKQARKFSDGLGYSDLESELQSQSYQLANQNVKSSKSLKRIKMMGDTPSFQCQPKSNSMADEQMPVDDFVKQMQDAGIDVADLQSNYNDLSRAADRSRDASLSWKKGKNSQQDKQNDDKEDMIQILDERAYGNSEQQKDNQKLKQQQLHILKLHKIKKSHKISSLQDDPLLNIQQGLKIQTHKKVHRQQFLGGQEQSSPKFYDTESYFNQNQQKIQKYQAIRSKIIIIHSNIKKVNNLRKQIIKIQQRFNVQKQNMVRQMKVWAEQLFKLIQKGKSLQQKNTTPNEKQISTSQIQIIQLLKFKVLKLQAKLLQKQIENQRHKQANQQLNNQKQQLSQTVFDLNQQLAQSQLKMQQKIQQHILKYQHNQKTKQVHNCSEKQVQRLNQQVEQLNKLYQQSHEQYKKSLHNERLTLSIQLQKIARKQVLLHQRQQKLQESMQKLKHQQQRHQKQFESLRQKENQIIQMEKNMKQKILKVEELEEELNQGFIYIEQVKKQQNLNEQKIQQQRAQLNRQISILQTKILKIQSQRLRQENQNKLLKQKSLPSQRLISRNSSSSANAQRIRQNLRRNRQLLTQYEQDGNDFDFDIRMNSKKGTNHYFNNDLQYTFMNTDRVMNNKSSKGYLSNEISKNMSKARLEDNYLDNPLLQKKYKPKHSFNKNAHIEYQYQDNSNNWKTKKQLQSSSQYPDNLKQYRRINYASPPNAIKMSQATGKSKLLKDQFHRKDSRFMSQVINPTYNCRNNINKNNQLGYPKLQQKQPPFGNLNSPNMFKMQAKFPSSKKIGLEEEKLNKLDNKIQILRNQIKREITAAKNT